MRIGLELSSQEICLDLQLSMLFIAIIASVHSLLVSVEAAEAASVRTSSVSVVMYDSGWLSQVLGVGSHGVTSGTGIRRRDWSLERK